MKIFFVLYSRIARKTAMHVAPKNRSPSVWRNTFELILSGPTISRIEWIEALQVINKKDFHRIVPFSNDAGKVGPASLLESSTGSTEGVLGSPLTCAKCCKCAFVTAL